MLRCQETDKRSNESLRSRKGARRYKTPSPKLLRSRREAANARERKRMNSLNFAFDKVDLKSINSQFNSLAFLATKRAARMGLWPKTFKIRDTFNGSRVSLERVGRS